MSTPYRSPGCAVCGAPRPAGAPTQASALCERCVIEAIADARRLLERLDAEPAPTPTPWGARLAAGLGVFVVGAVTMGVGLAAMQMRGVISSAHRAALQQMRAPSDGADAEDPDLPSRAGPPRDAMARPPTARSDSAQRSPDPPPPAPRSHEPLAWPPALLATTGGPVTHDPEELLARAERLADAGADVSIHEVRLSPTSLPIGGSTRLAPVPHKGGPIGVRLSHVGPLLEEGGLANGDLVTSVNGYAYPDEPRRWLDPFLEPSGRAVIEVLRGTRRVVLSVRWRAPLAI